MIRDVQGEIITALSARLSTVAQIEEGDVRSLFDVEDEALPDDFIVIQQGSTSEQLNGHPRMPRSVPEQTTINLVLVSKRRHYAPQLRAMRLAVKQHTAGPRCGLDAVSGITSASFLTETPTPPADGRRFAAHVMPLQITYVQPLV